MAQRESRLSKRILDAIRAPDCFAWKVWGNDMQLAGLPDIVGVVQGKFFGIETKLPESRDHVSVKQVWIHDQLAQAGGAVKICCSVVEAKAFVDLVRVS